MLNRTLAPEHHEIQQIALIEPGEISFANGLKVFVFRAPEQQLIKAEFIFHNLFSDVENPLLHTCLSHMIKEGTSSRNSAQIAEEVDFYGSYLMPEYSFDHTSLTLYTLSKHAHAVFPLVHDVLNNSIFPEAELETYVRNNKQTLQISLQKNDYVARRIFYNTVFGHTRYGITPTAEAYDRLNREDLLALYAKQIQPHNCTLILSGNVGKDVLDQLQTLFDGAWQAGTDNFPPAAPVLPSAAAQLIVEARPDALQSAIRMGMPTINRRHPDYPALQFVNTLFGGYFGSRLMHNIREEKGFTYSIGSACASLQHSGFFTIATEVGVANTGETLIEIEREMDKLGTDLASEQEIELVKNYMLGSMLGSLESIFSHADKFKSIYFYGLGFDYYRRYSDTIREMDAERVRRIAQQYFRYDSLVKVVVGKID